MIFVDHEMVPARQCSHGATPSLQLTNSFANKLFSNFVTEFATCTLLNMMIMINKQISLAIIEIWLNHNRGV